MKTLEFSFILRAASPIAHHRETKGNIGILAREPVILPSGERREVPIVSGNAMRHGCRDAIARLTLDALGLLKPGSFDHLDSLRFLFNGGSGSGSDNTVKLDEVRAMRRLVPSTALLGGSSNGQIHYGQLEVAPARLVCSETWHDLEEWQWQELAEFAVQPSVAYEVLDTQYRNDETSKPQGRFLLTEAAQALINDREGKRERARDAADEVAADESKGGMMPHSGEVVIRGSLWTWSVVGHVTDELEEITLRAMLSAFLRRCVVGSQRRVGKGRFVVCASRGFDHLRPAEALRAMSLSDLSGPEHEAPFLSHLAERADEARAWLRAAT